MTDTPTPPEPSALDALLDAVGAVIGSIPTYAAEEREALRAAAERVREGENIYDEEEVHRWILRERHQAAAEALRPIRECGMTGGDILDFDQELRDCRADHGTTDTGPDEDLVALAVAIDKALSDD